MLWLLGAVCLAGNAMAQQPAHWRGYVAAKSVDCFNPECHHLAPQFFLVDDATGQKVRITGHDKQLSALHPRQKVSIRGVRRGQASKKATTDAAADSQADIEIQELEVLPLTQDAQAADLEPAVAHGANTLTMLSTLLVFVSTNTHACMTSETNARNRLFNNTANANQGMQAITKGRYGLRLGNGTGVPDDHTMDLLLNVNSADHDSQSIEDLAMAKLFDSVASGGLGLNRLDWDRILLFAPDGMTDSSSLTAYAQYPWGPYTTSGMLSVYGRSYGNSYMNGYLHELGHNFGFRHSSKGISVYGDRTCVMGLSTQANRTETYNAVKLLETNWLDVFPKAKLALTTDTTIDLYPLGSDPNVINETIAVSYPSNAYYLAYHRDQQPYGYLSQAEDKDKLFIYTGGSGVTSDQIAKLSLGARDVRSGTAVKFERYGPNNEYVTVSFDMNDGNAKPVANARSLTATINTSLTIALSGSDGDGDSLTYTKVTDPANGVISGTAPNLTYTPNNNYLGSDSFVFKVDDGKISSFATISIEVSSTLPSGYATWAANFFTSPPGNNATSANPDGDSNTNFLEFAFGTNPILKDGGPLNPTGSVNGQPIVRANGNKMELFFVRRKDHGASGGVSYTVRFSGDLITFYDSAVAPSFVANSSANSDYEVVKVAYPTLLPNSQAARFGLVQVNVQP